MGEKSTVMEPKFQELPGSLLNHIDESTKLPAQVSHSEVLKTLLEGITPIDFVALSHPQVISMREKLAEYGPESDEAKDIIKQLDQVKVNSKHYLVLSIENILKLAEKNRWGLCKNLDFIYVFNGAYWSYVDKEAFQKFLGEAALKMGVPQYTAKHYQFREQLLSQFLSLAYLPTPEASKDSVFINLKNGTFEITPDGTKLRKFSRKDFITYQLPFNYEPCAIAPTFQRYLDRVLPDVERQRVLAEFLGYVFIRNGGALKLEKALILYGTGANGKSVFNEIVNALLGNENISPYSLESLTDLSGYNRAMIANKLVNYASEISVKLEAALFKQMVSGEPISARLPYGRPMTLTQYAKLIFNCNELPKEVEHSNAYFRRFLIIPFDVTIPEAEQDKQLHSKIIESELSGVFNWVLDGLNRLLSQKRFSDCDAALKAVEQYKSQSDSVQLFIEDSGYVLSAEEYKLIKELYQDYRVYCTDDGCKPVQKKNFIKRLENLKITVEKKNVGNVAFIKHQSA